VFEFVNLNLTTRDRAALTRPWVGRVGSGGACTSGCRRFPVAFFCLLTLLASHVSLSPTHSWSGSPSRHGRHESRAGAVELLPQGESVLLHLLVVIVVDAISNLHSTCMHCCADVAPQRASGGFVCGPLQGVRWPGAHVGWRCRQ
jgi:hypothetical protein